MAKAVSALVPYFGSNRLLAHRVGELLAGCTHAVVPFAGGMSELLHITARTIVVGDLHRDVINLANVLRDPEMGSRLIRELRRLPFHEDVLRFAQEQCRSEAEPPAGQPVWDRLWNYHLALNYFVCAWMGRNGTAGTDGEFRGGLSVRWDAGGGDSATRFRSAVEALRDWRKVIPRCTFLVRDCFELLADVKDRAGHGIYCDPPFPDAGEGYRHNPGPAGSAEERAFHVRLAQRLSEFKACKVVLRFYRHPLVEELYPVAQWRWVELKGGKTQTNAPAPEVLLVNDTAETSVLDRAG
jgi:DNA adenine methylase